MTGLSKIFKGLVAVTGLAALVGCYKEDIELHKTRIRGDTTIRLVQQVYDFEGDNYRLEVYDDKGVLRVTFYGSNNLVQRSKTKIIGEDMRTFRMTRDGNSGYITNERR